jgi:hypothetical protein
MHILFEDTREFKKYDGTFYYFNGGPEIYAHEASVLTYRRKKLTLDKQKRKRVKKRLKKNIA